MDRNNPIIGDKNVYIDIDHLNISNQRCLVITKNKGTVELFKVCENQITLMDDIPLRANSADLYRYFHLPISAADPDNTLGGEWYDPSSDTLGGYRINSSQDKFHFEPMVYDDWDGESDLHLDVYFESNVDNSGGSVDDVVHVRCEVYYKGIGEKVTKYQQITDIVTVGQCDQYTLFKAQLVIDWDATDNVVQKGDSFKLQLHNYSSGSDIDDYIFNQVWFYYKTKYANTESGSV